MNSTYDILFKNHVSDDGIIKKSKISHIHLNQIYHGYANLTHLRGLPTVTFIQIEIASSRGIEFWPRLYLAQTQQGEGILHDFWLGLVQNKQFREIVVHEHV